MNSCNFTGRLGKDWEVQYSQAGKAVAKNSMTLRKYNGDSVWINLVAFSDRGENVAKFTQKGSMLSVQCSVDVSEYEKEGRKNYFTNFIIDNFTLVEKKQDSQQGQFQQTQGGGFQTPQQQGFKQAQQDMQHPGNNGFQSQGNNQGFQNQGNQGFSDPAEDD